jgi:hypothetical protein
LYASLGIINLIKSKRMGLAGHLARMDETRNAYKILAEKLKGKRPLLIPRCRWEDNTRMDLRETGW